MDNKIESTETKLKSLVEECIINTNKSIDNWKFINNISIDKIDYFQVRSIFLQQIKRWILKDPVLFKYFSKNCMIFIDNSTKHITSITTTLSEDDYRYNKSITLRNLEKILNKINYNKINSELKLNVSLNFDLSSIQNINF